MRNRKFGRSEQAEQVINTIITNYFDKKTLVCKFDLEFFPEIQLTIGFWQQIEGCIVFIKCLENFMKIISII